MRSGRDGPGNRDVWERGEVVDGPTGVVQRLDELAVTRASVHCGRVSCLIDIERDRKVIERDLDADGVSNLSEGMPTAEGLDTLGFNYDILKLIDGIRLSQPAR